MGIILAMLFSQAPCGLFLPHSDFYLRLRMGRLMALFYRLPFPYDSHPPKITGFAYADKIHVFRPFRLAALVCRSARCGYLTPYLSVPKRTDEFLIFPASKIGFPQKGLFVSRSRRSLLFCFLILFFTIYFFIRFSPYLFAVCLAFEYMTIIKPFFRTAKLFEKKNLERSKNSLFANMERTRAK